MSSPTQLSQPFELNSEVSGNGSRHSTVPGMVEDIYADSMHHHRPNHNQQHHHHHDNFGQHSQSQDSTYLRNDDLDTMTEGEIVPVSTNLPHNKYFHIPEDSLNFNSLTHLDSINTNLLESTPSQNNRYSHSRNISLDDSFDFRDLPDIGSRRTYNHQSTLSTSSILSVNQNPPSFPIPPNPNTYNNGAESISSNTVYSFDSIPQLTSSVSNQSLADSPNSLRSKQQPAHSITQSISVVPTTNTTMATPRRTGRPKSLSISSSNLYATPSRGGLNNPLSPVNLATAALNKITKTPYSSKSKTHSRSRSRASVDIPTLVKSSSSSSAYSLNPFYSSSQFVSPIVDRTLNDDVDDDVTLLTPSGNRGGGGDMNGSMGYNNPAYFSPIKYKQEFSNGATPLDIESQEDDALKEIRKAKSFSNLSGNPNSIRRSSRMNNNGSQFGHWKSASGSFSVNGHGNGSGSASSAGSFAEDLSIRLENQINQPPQLKNEPTSGVVYNATLNVATTVPGGEVDYYDQQNIKTEDNSRIDLLSPHQFNHASTTTFAPNGKNLTKSLSQSAATRSYPASIDLAAIASGASDVSPVNGGLLPPMATFTVSPQNDHEKEKEQQQNEHKSSKGEIKRSDSFEEMDDDGTVTFPIPDNLQITIPVVRNNRSKDKQNETSADLSKKKHRCPICDCRFQRPEHVKRHIKSHSAEKPFSCEEIGCGKRFNRKDNLKAHLKKIHGKFL
ncbi:uncharacterized protein J8A68_001307 [[Candida] subhashii]|uniref:pH-response transcription factor pacC/RIM101 n=1 Tax=[Candida] subhashii TaxID=561895 RepID=A0A8J5UR63_9ASCO|nr:uncharacterized protein J8A68_001307 [[Candida] subhashii]KAG7665251.1 hypothetical protein J8A68_001307 [[Candida] subhashii]